MEILKNLDEGELPMLREKFEENGPLPIEDFEKVLTEVCRTKPHINVRNLKLRELFNDIDVNGDQSVSWEEFTMFLITGATTNTSAMGDDEPMKEYHPMTAMCTEVPNTIVSMKFEPILRQIIQVTRRAKASSVKLRSVDHPALPMSVKAPDIPGARVQSAAYVPKHGELNVCNVLAVGYDDCYIRMFDLGRRDFERPHELLLRKEIEVDEVQSVVRWSSKYRRLFCGSRTGIISTLHVDDQAFAAREHVHKSRICEMIVHGHKLYSGSIDASIKCMDLEKGIVQFALEGYSETLTTFDVAENFQQLFTAGAEPYPLVYSTSMPKLPPVRLIDKNRPHHTRIVSVLAVPNTPQLISADAAGLVKMWDLRVMGCFQSIAIPKDEVSLIPASATSMGYVPELHRLVVNGRDTRVFDYDQSSNPHLTDDEPSNLMLYNEMSSTFLTVHGTTVKLWDASNGTLRNYARDIVPHDISAVCLATPRCRKFFVGTTAGEIYCFAYAMLTLMRDFPPAYTEKSEVISMVYVEEFKDNKNPYVVVAFKHEIILLPDTEEHVQKSALKLLFFDEVIRDCDVKSMGLTQCGYAVIGTSNGAIHVADLNNFALTASVKIPDFTGELSSLLVKPLSTAYGSLLLCTDGAGEIWGLILFSSTHCELYCRWKAATVQGKGESLQTAHSGDISPEIAKAEAARGNAPTPAVVQSYSVFATLDATPGRGASDTLNDLNATIASDQKTLVSPAEQSTSHLDGRELSFKLPALTGTYGEKDFAGTSASQSTRIVSQESDHRGNMKGNNSKTQQTRKSSSATLLGPNPNSAVAGYFSRGRDVVFTYSVTTMKLIEELRLLVTGDEKGMIALWDLTTLFENAEALVKHDEKIHGSAAVEAGLSPGVRSPALPPPRLPEIAVPCVVRWQAHHRGETSSICCVRMQLPKKVVEEAAMRPRTPPPPLPVPTPRLGLGFSSISCTPTKANIDSKGILTPSSVLKGEGTSESVLKKGASIEETPPPPPKSDLKTTPAPPRALSPSALASQRSTEGKASTGDPKPLNSCGFTATPASLPLDSSKKEAGKDQADEEEKSGSKEMAVSFALASTGTDRVTLLWGLDGVSLGNLAQGRSENQAGGAFISPTKRILPYYLENPPPGSSHQTLSCVANSMEYYTLQKKALQHSTLEAMLEASQETNPLEKSSEITVSMHGTEHDLLGAGNSGRVDRAGGRVVGGRFSPALSDRGNSPGPTLLGPRIIDDGPSFFSLTEPGSLRYTRSDMSRPVCTKLELPKHLKGIVQPSCANHAIVSARALGGQSALTCRPTPPVAPPHTARAAERTRREVEEQTKMSKQLVSLGECKLINPPNPPPVRDKPSRLPEVHPRRRRPPPRKDRSPGREKSENNRENTGSSPEREKHKTPSAPPPHVSPAQLRGTAEHLSKKTLKFLHTLGWNDNPLETAVQKEFRRHGRVVLGVPPTPPSGSIPMEVEGSTVTMMPLPQRQQQQQQEQQETEGQRKEATAGASVRENQQERQLRQMDEQLQALLNGSTQADSLISPRSGAGGRTETPPQRWKPKGADIAQFEMSIRSL